MNELVKEISKRGIQINEVYLFGSYARGDFVETSDVDLIIVSDDFEGMKFLERLSLLYSIFDEEASLVPLTKEELNEKKERSVVIRDASRYWVKIYP